MRVRPAWWVMAAVVLLVVGVAAGTVATRAPDVHVTTSSAATSTPPDDLLDLPTDPGRHVVWQSRGEAIGAWLDTTWSRPTVVDRVRVRSASDSPVRAGLLTFDGGASLAVQLDADGEADVTFPPRTVSSVRFTVADATEGATSVALTGLLVDDTGLGVPDTGLDDVVPSVSDGDPAALVDGDPAGDRATGQEWSTGGAAGWAELAWPSPRLLSAVQVFGPAEAPADPDHRFAPALRGQLVFSDGSTVIVSGIAGGSSGPTTVAFAPRMADGVRLELTVAQPEAVLGLRELRAVPAGTTPPRWAESGGQQLPEVVPPDAERCDQAAPPTERPTAELRLVCPAPGSGVGGPFTLAVDAPPGERVTARAATWSDGQPAGVDAVVAEATADSAGRALLTVDPATLNAGPLAIAVTGDDPTRPGAPLVAQLWNRTGHAVAATDSAPEGMTLQWDEDFHESPSASADGVGTTYAAAKPAYWGPAGFGDADFADPAEGGESLAVVGGDYLRLRATPAADAGVTTSYGEEYVSGLLSSLGVGATGFAAQYGYFEARMTGGPGPGSWPAFWMLNTQSATTDDQTSGEVDAVELYGHNPLGSCHTLHDWGRPGPEPETTEPSCTPVNGFSDWTTTWHTYGARITPDGAVFTIDGVEIARDRGLARSSEPFFFLVNLALGGGWPVDLTAGGERSDLYVDWVRVYT